MTRSIAIASAVLFGASALGVQPPAAQPTTAPPAGQPSAVPPKPATQPPKGDDKKDDKKVDRLKVGDPAPVLKIDQWVKGDSVTGYERGKVYALVFWSTTNRQSVDEIPHLTDLQKNYKDMVIVGIAGPGKGEATGDATVGEVEKFVKDMGTKIGFRIGFDATGMAFRPFMEAAGRNALPTAFLVDDTSKIAWIGHPKELDKQIERLMELAPKPKN